MPAKIELARGAYRIMVGDEERCQIAARHWGVAGSQIYYRCGDEWEATPYQVADARHSSTDAALLIDAWLEGQTGEGFLAEGEEFELVDLIDEDDDEDADAILAAWE